MNREIDWLKKNKEFISSRAIEKHLGIPDTVLAKAVRGTQKLSRKWEEPLKQFLKEMIQDY